MTGSSAGANFLEVFWPFFVLAEQKEAAEGTPLAELMAPDQPDTIRTVFYPIFERTNVTASLGLLLAEDAELLYWGRVFRAPLLTGAEGEGTFLPDWLTHNGQILTGLAALLRLPLYQRFDVFLSAMHQRGLA